MVCKKISSYQLQKEKKKIKTQFSAVPCKQVLTGEKFSKKPLISSFPPSLRKTQSKQALKCILYPKTTSYIIIPVQEKVGHFFNGQQQVTNYINSFPRKGEMKENNQNGMEPGLSIQPHSINLTQLYCCWSLENSIQTNKEIHYRCYTVKKAILIL